MILHDTGTDGYADRPSIKTFVMRKGRMTDAQKKAYQNLAGIWCIPYQNAVLDFASVFGNATPTIVEIGFGMGTATAAIAQEHPAVNYIGIEVYQAGVGKLLSEIERLELRNLRIIEYDALEVLRTMIPDGSLAGLHVFFPDPWQKTKHHKRRLMHRPRTDLLAAKLVPEGYIYMVTDWYEYALDAFSELSHTQGLYSRYEGFAPPQPWRPRTKFEQKGLTKQHAITELFFVRSL